MVGMVTETYLEIFLVIDIQQNSRKMKKHVSSQLETFQPRYEINWLFLENLRTQK